MNMLGIFGKGKKNKMGPIEYGTEFKGAFESQNIEKMIELSENWLKDCPNDANAHYAQGVLIGVLSIMGKVDKNEAIEALDLIAEKAPKLANETDGSDFDIKKIMLEGFYEGLFESCYNDVKSR